MLPPTDFNTKREKVQFELNIDGFIRALFGVEHFQYFDYYIFVETRANWLFISLVE